MLTEQPDWTAFRSLSTLTRQAGVPTEHLARLVAKELADNALDKSGACEYGMLEGRTFYIANPGEGIPGTDADIARLFSIGRPLVSSKLLRLPTRGALGNGLRVVAGAVLASGGSLTVSTSGRTLRLTPKDDGTTSAENIRPFEEEGTRIEVTLGREAGHIDLHWVRMAVLMALGGPGYKGATSPHWYDTESFFELLQASGERSVRDLIAELDGCSGKRAGEIAAAYKLRPVNQLTREEASDLLCAARQNAKPVSPQRLGFVGPVDSFPESYANLTGVHALRSARGKIHADLPYVVEVWADFHHDGGLNVWVNRTPATGTIKAYLQEGQLAVHGCGLTHLCGKVGKKLPCIWLNITTPYMPITSAGKAPDLTPFLPAISETIEKAVSKAKRQQGTDREKTITEKDLILQNLEEGCKKAGGGMRFSQRQLFYAIRAIAQKPDMNWKNFCTVITDYEKEMEDDVPGMYRDPRGILYHPHLRQEIPLGTLAVERYTRPEWLFNKVLFIEKEGFFAALKEIQWPERNDCALLTSKGFASRAARDVIDLLGETDEEITFYCVHDADASGTLIYQALQEATRARPARRVKIENLGLEPEEALRMELEPERFTREKPAPVAEYVSQEWKEWLQTNRVELNAMSTPQFVAWLDSKFAQEAGKVIPPVDIMETQLREEISAQVKAALTETILQEANFEERTEQRIEELESTIAETLLTLTEEITTALEDVPENLWTEPVKTIAEEIAAAQVGPDAAEETEEPED